MCDVIHNIMCRSHLKNVGVWVVMSKNHHPFSKSTKNWNILLLYNQRLPQSTIWKLQWSHIFSRSNVVDPDPLGCRFGSRWWKLTHKTRKKWRYVLFWSAGCSLLRAGGFSCSLEVFQGGQGVTKRCRLSWLTNSALVYEPKWGMEGGGGCGVSANEYSCAYGT
jgi:hypothetical protein